MPGLETESGSTLKETIVVSFLLYFLTVCFEFKSDTTKGSQKKMKGAKQRKQKQPASSKHQLNSMHNHMVRTSKSFSCSIGKTNHPSVVWDR